jgi:hypothetical protein
MKIAENYIKQKERYIPIIKEVIEIMNDMARAVPAKYSQNKIYPLRDLCLGYLLICKSNVEAALCLFENNHGHQINYINRNMFEMVVTLFYIKDDDKKIDERVTRYFEYNNAVIKYKTKEIVRKNRDIFSQEMPDELMAKVDQQYKKFVDKYYQGSKKSNINSWSGMKMPDMIESLSSQSDKENLLRHYRVAVNLNNTFLHPTGTFIRSASSAFYQGKIDYNHILLQIATVLHLAGHVIDIFLSQFQKGRPAFQARVEAVGERFIRFENDFVKG